MTPPNGGRAQDRDTEFDPDRVVVRDKRRLDPHTGAVKSGGGDGQPAEGPVGGSAVGPGGSAGSRGGGGASSPGGGMAGSDPDDADLAAEQDRLAAELTSDLQRVTAEYANYRKRVERDRVAVVEMATAGLLSELLPVLDDLERARQHGDLTGAFGAVGERLEQVAVKAGLEKFGQPGEPFDPAVHEALMQAEPDPAATVPVCAQVLQPGYRLRSGRVLRPARVSVAEPAGQVAGQVANQPAGGPEGGSAVDAEGVAGQFSDEAAGGDAAIGDPSAGQAGNGQVTGDRTGGRS